MVGGLALQGCRHRCGLVCDDHPGALISEVYPTEVSATAQNVLFNLVALSEVLVPWSLARSRVGIHSQRQSLCWHLIYLVDIVTTRFLILERKGFTLE